MRRFFAFGMLLFFSSACPFLFARELEDEVTPIYPESLSPADAAIFSGALFNREIQTYYSGVSMPLLSNEKNLLMMEANFAWTDPLDEQINVGLVHRWKFPHKDWIVGENVFFDYGNSSNGNGFCGVGTGMEVLSSNFEFRFNYYWPDPRQPEISPGFSTSSSSSTTNDLGTTVTTTQTGSTTTSTIVNQTVEEEEGGIVTTTTFQDTTRESFLRKTTHRFETINTFSSYNRSPIYEAAMQGFDVEMGIPLRLKREEVIPMAVGGKNPVWVDSIETSYWPHNLNVWGFVGYEDFQNPFGSDVAGFKTRVEWRVNPHLLIEGKYHESPWPQIGGNWYAGFRVTCNIDDPQDDRNLFARLFTPTSETPEKARWLQKVGRDPRYRFGESKRTIDTVNTVDINPGMTMTQTPFSRFSSALRQIVTIQPFE